MPPSTPTLTDAYGGGSLREYLSDCWSRRHYVRFVALGELRSRQMTSVLGNLWHLLNPLLQIGVYFLIFGLVLRTDRGIDNFLTYVTVGIFVYMFTQRCTILGASSVVGNRGILTQFRFPRAILPLTTALTETIAMVPPLFVIYVTALLTGESARWTWALLPFVLAGQAFFNAGLALVAARATHHLRDITQILPFVFRLLFYGSGIIFAVDAFGPAARFQWVFYLNPIYDFIQLARWSVVGGSVDGIHVLAAGLWTVLILAGGLLWFRRAEHLYAGD